MTTIKNLWKTPGKAILAALCLVAALAVVGGGAMFAVSAVAEQSSIGKENAQNFAFADAGIDPVSAENVHTTFAHKQGQFVYEVEFTAGGTEYEYWIKADDGTVVKKEQELIDDNKPVTVNPTSITLDEAKQIALKDAQVTTSDAIFVKEQADRDDGITVYEVTFTVGQVKYEYEIDGTTGAIIDKSQETITALNQPQAGSEAIDLQAAKNVALQDAGVQEADVTYTKTERDEDDDKFVYEIDFYTTTHAYEYEIDAKNGNIIKRESKERPAASKPSEKSDSYIGTKKAKEIALQHAGLQASEVTFSKVKQERDDGKQVYEIEFRHDHHTEYEYTIDAISGKILEHDVDHDDDHD